MWLTWTVGVWPLPDRGGCVSRNVLQEIYEDDDEDEDLPPLDLEDSQELKRRIFPIHVSINNINNNNNT